MDIKLKRLLAQGVKVNARNSYGDSPLHFAAHCCKDQLACIKKLMMYEADINATNIHGNTPLHVIVNPPPSSCPPNANKNKSILSSDNKNSTLQLHETLLDEVSSECIAVLLEHGALADAKNRSSSTPLHCIQFSDGDLRYGVRLLVKYGANINAQNYNGETPLHKAVLRNDFNEDLLEELRTNGADFTKENWEHETPIASFLHKKVNPQMKVSLCDMDCAKYLITHTLYQMSQKIDFTTDTIKTFGDHLNYFDKNVFNHFQECFSELTRMKTDMITNKLSLKDYVTLDKTIDGLCLDSQCIAEQLFDRLCNCSYPIYSYALFDALNRSTLLNKLEMLRFHVTCSKSNKVNKVVRLHSCSTLEIATYLPDKDLLNFIIAICGKTGRAENKLPDMSHIVKQINAKFISCFFNYSTDCCKKHRAQRWKRD